MPYQLLHNPRCSKSRQAKQLLDDRGVKYQIIEYLKTPLSEEELRELATKLGVPPAQMLRKKEQAYKEMGLDQEGVTGKDIFRAIADEPVLLERPILVKGQRAVIGRPTENLETLL